MSALYALFSGMRAAATGMTAERLRIDVIAGNIANAQTTYADGSPYRRQVVCFEPVLERLENGATLAKGVRVSDVRPDMTTPLRRLHDPSHPYADANGFVDMPNVNPTREMVDLITAVRAYEANMRAQDAFVKMAERALQLAR